jgi:hypothetical protein
MLAVLCGKSGIVGRLRGNYCSGNVSGTVWEQVGLWEGGIAVTNDTGPGLVRTPLQCITGPTGNYLYCLYTYRNTLPNL